MERLPYSVVLFSERVNLKPHQLDNNLDQRISFNARKKLERHCSKHGYVRGDSVVVVSRSLGQALGCHFAGEITYLVEVVADVCNPLRGDRLYCRIENVNRMGLLAKAGDDGEVHVYVVTQHHDNARFFDDPRLKEGAHLEVEVVGRKYQLGGKDITVIARVTKLYDDDELDDYPGKTVALPTAEAPEERLELTFADEPPEGRAYLGFETFAKTVRSLREGRRACPAEGCADEFELLGTGGERRACQLRELAADFKLAPGVEEVPSMVSAHIGEAEDGAWPETVAALRRGRLPDPELAPVADVAHVAASGNVPAAFCDAVVADGGAQLVTADALDDDDSCRLLYAQAAAIAACQRAGGACVLRVGPLFSKASAKLAVALAARYEAAWLTKPYASRSASAERYVVCVGARGGPSAGLLDAAGAWPAGRFLSDVAFVLFPEAREALYRFSYVNDSQRRVRALSRPAAPEPTELQARAARAWRKRYGPPEIVART